MLAKLRSGSSPPNSPETETHGVTNGGSSPTLQSQMRAAKLKKRKPAKSISQIDKCASTPESCLQNTPVASTPPKDGDRTQTKPAVVPPKPNDATLSMGNSPTLGHRAFTIIRRPESFPSVNRHTSLQNIDSASTSKKTQKKETNKNQADRRLPGDTRGRKHSSRSRNSSADNHRASTYKLKKSPREPPSSAMRRRFSYTPPSPQNKPFEDSLAEEELKNLSIMATRIPDFSSAYESKNPSSSIQVTVVDQLPHQTSTSPTRTRSSIPRPISQIPPTIEERDVNEEFLLDQQEVMSYLQNTLLRLSSPAASPRTLVSDGGLPMTPPGTTSKPLQSDQPVAPDLIDKMISEFPYLLGEDDAKSIFQTEPLHLQGKSELYGLGSTPSTSSLSSSAAHIRTEFPPSPPQSEGRRSLDDSRVLMEELGLESDSMRSVVDAINRAVSSSSSLNYMDGCDNESISEESVCDGGESTSVTLNGERPWTFETIDADDDSVYNFTSPILRTGRASFAGVQYRNPALSRSASQVSKIAVVEDSDVPISEVLAERRRCKPELAPLVITPIVPGQYGPPIKRRQHLRGKGRLSSPMSARGGLDAVRPSLVKVVEEEVVEYTPIEEGEKGWIRQRRVSRGGDWIVVEREILKQGAI